MGVHTRLVALALLVAGCDGEETPPKDAGTEETGTSPEDTDADTDADSDSDTDTDADADAGPFDCVDEDLGNLEALEVQGDTTGQGNDGLSSCGGEGGSDVVYLYTAPEDGDYVFQASSASLDTLVAVYETCGGTELGCDDDGGGDRAARLRLTLAGAQQVVVWVDGYYDEGDFSLAVSHPPHTETACTDDLDEDEDLLLDCLDPDCLLDAACEQVCPDQVVGTLPAIIVGSTLGAPDIFQGYCSEGTPPSSDQSHSFTAPYDGRFLIRLDPAGTNFDSVLSLWDGCAGSEMLCQDEFEFGGEQWVLDLIADQVLLLVVDGYEGAAGDYTLTVDHISSVDAPCTGGVDEDYDNLTDCYDPDCDADTISCPEICGTLVDEDGDGRIDCADGACAAEEDCQVTCPEDTLTGSLPIVAVSSTLGLGDEWTSSCNRYAPASDETWSFTAPVDGTYTFTVEGEVYDPIVFVMDGCGGAELGCNDDYDLYVAGPDARVQLALVAQQEVVVVVDGYDGQSGNYTLTVQ